MSPERRHDRPRFASSRRLCGGKAIASPPIGPTALRDGQPTGQPPEGTGNCTLDVLAGFAGLADATSARAREPHVVCAAPPPVRRAEHRTDRPTPVRPQMGARRHGVSAAGPNLGACKHLRPMPGRSVPTARGLHGCMDMRTKTMVDAAMLDAVATYTGTIKQCPTGRARAPEEKRFGEAQFQCACGQVGTMPYLKLFRHLRQRPLTLKCQRCGRVLR